MMNEVSNPKAFISHASADKERFVDAFALKLRKNGVDAWYDKWEIQPGDSLVQKIFSQGIAEAEVFIVILSRNSVDKRWVKEELDSGVVRKINEDCRLIPIILDDCDVPVPLRHLRWEKVRNLDDWEPEFQRILNVIVGGSEKPPLGDLPPMATNSVINFLPGLSKTDNLVFEVLGNRYLDSGKIGMEVEKEFSEFEKLGLSREEVSESLEMLHSERWVEVLFRFNAESGKHEVGHARIEWRALVKFAQRKFPDYDERLRDLISALVNMNLEGREEILAETSMPERLLEIIARDLEVRGLIDLLTGSKGTVHCIIPISPRLKRMLG